MTEAFEPDWKEVLDQDTLELLGSAPAPAAIASEHSARLRERVMKRVEGEVAIAPPFITIRGDDDRWIELEPLIEKKVLSVNHKTGIESYLLRLQPGAAPDRHQHNEDELCVVLEGDVSFDGIHLEAGDFHFARKGSWHGRASTVNGALLFLQSGVPTAQTMA